MGFVPPELPWPCSIISSGHFFQYDVFPFLAVFLCWRRSSRLGERNRSCRQSCSPHPAGLQLSFLGHYSFEVGALAARTSAKRTLFPCLPQGAPTSRR